MVLEIPKGYRFGTYAGGLRYQGRDDLTLILSDTPAAAAGVFTRNRFQAAPVLVAQDIVRGGSVRAVLVNSGQANACTGDMGIAACRECMRIAAEELGIREAEILPASTGVIGEHLPMERMHRVLPRLADRVGKCSPEQAARAITTTDKFPKLSAAGADLSAGRVRVLGLAKGAGMICPDMATMLGFILCDAQVEPGVWQEILGRAVDKSFNAISVDGDTSTNDCVLALANGAGGTRAEKQDIDRLAEAVLQVCQELSYQIVQDAEGGTKVVHIKVSGAADGRQAEAAARAVGNSPLVKTALYGNDPNWGRIVAALGRSGADFDPRQVRVFLGGYCIFENGCPAEGDIDALFARFLRGSDVYIGLELGRGAGEYALKASDLTHEYVSINAEYRT
ncbi:MAG: bifunctional glutamate N-acetyltransferase/amino-acid acetyltransferase ArgJ [Desulfonatronovibrionaceae bacterium]